MTSFAADLAAALDPVALAVRTGMAPDDWQAQVLRSDAKRLALLCSRQAGKSTTTAVLAVHHAVYTPDALVLLIAPSQRQSDELYGKCRAVYRQLGRPLGAPRESATELRLENGARIVSLPGTEQTTRGFSGVTLLVVDEASRVPDEVFAAVLPMVGVSGGRLLALSTPAGARGWFHETWTSDDPRWDRVKVTGPQVPRLTPDFLAEARARLGQWLFRQEYLCEFVDIVDQVFATDHVEAAFATDGTVAPLFDSQIGAVA